MNFGLWLAAVLQMPVTRVPSWGSPAEAQLSPCRAEALGGVHLQGLAVSASPLGNHRRSSCQILCSWLLRCWSALCAQPPQLPVPAELHRASRALLLWESAENSSQVPPLLSARVQCRRGHSLAFFSVRITATNKAGLSGGLFLLLL